MDYLTGAKEILLRPLRSAVWVQGFLSPMTAYEAQRILGLSGSWRERDLLDSYRALLMKNHPDRGGSSYISQKINEAKSLLQKDVHGRRH